MTSLIPQINWLALGPHVLVVITAFIVMFVDLAIFRRRDYKNLFATNLISLLGLVITLAYLCSAWKYADNPDSMRTLYGAVVLDRFSIFFDAIFVLAGIFTVLFSWHYGRLEEINHGEYYTLLLFAIYGMMCMVSTHNLLMLFLGLELMSIAVYVLAGQIRGQQKSGEAALKYFLLGAFSTGFLLFGIVGIFGATGSLDITQIGLSENASKLQTILALGGVGFLLVGFGFKTASVPFHMWTPDVYDGAPTTITGFMAVGVKAAAFAAFLRVFGQAFFSINLPWTQILWVIAVLTMTYGNIVAIVQTNVKRMLAYSSIAHAGYILVGLVALFRSKEFGAESIAFYLLAYAFMNLGAFGLVSYIAKKGDTEYSINSYAGLASRHPVLAAALAIFLFSLAGIPPFGGFFAKFYVFSAGVKAGLYGLVVIGVLNSMLSVYYYIRVVYLMYMKEADETAYVAKVSSPNFLASLGIVIAAAFTIVLGILPDAFASLVKLSIANVFKF